MAEEKYTPESNQLNDGLTADDVDMLRLVLQSAHLRGATPVAIYNQADIIHDDF